MKRYLFVALLLLVSAVSFAQVKVENKTTGGIEYILRFSDYCSFCYSDGTYFLNPESSNKYDRNVIIILGKSKASALATVKDLKSIMNSWNEEDMAEVTISGKKWYLIKSKERLVFKDSKMAGFAKVPFTHFDSVEEALKARSK